METTTATAARVTFTDGTAFNLSNDAGMTPKEFVRDPNRASNSARLALNQGAFTLTAGKRTKSGGLRIDTPVARIRGTLQDRAISTLTLALTFSVIDKIQAASWPNAFLDDDAAAYKDLAHGTYEIIMKKDGRIFRHEDPGETIVVDPTGEVTRIPNSSSRMADLQNFQQAALATLSQGPQGAAAGGSSTETFNAPLQLLPINFIRLDNGAVQNQVTLNAAPATSGFIEVVQLKQLPPPSPPPPAPPPVLTAEQEAHQIIEVPHITGSTALDIAPSTTLTFTDLKLSAVSASLASITWSGGTTPPSGLVGVLANALSVTAEAADTAGSITATFSAADKNFDFLAANETLTIVYTVTAADTDGVTLTQPVTITIAGSNDPPVLAADTSKVHAVAEGLTTPGTLTFTDVDLTDYHTVITSVASATWSGGTTLPSGLATVLTDALSTATTDSTDSGSGSISLTFSAADAAFDFLAAGQTLTVVYNVTITDEGGVSSTQPVTITVIGTNDAPVVSTTSNAFTELVGTNNATPDTISGAISFTDVDLTDRPLASAVFNSYTYTDAAHNPLTLTPAQLAAVAVPVSVAQAVGDTNNGSASWTYSLSDSQFDFLATGETLTLMYIATVDDGHGGVVSQPFTVIITGTNDAPVITSGAQSGSVSEIADGAGGENAAPHSLSGAVTFTDVDLSDIETSSITNKQVVAPLANGYALSAAQQNALLNAFTIDAATHSPADGTGSIVWHYNINDLALDFLGKNDQVVLTFTVQVADGNGGFATQDVKITVIGAEDAPVITSGVQSGSVSHGTTTTHSLSGAVTFTDVDLSDIETSSITNKQVVATLANGATLSAAQQNALLNAFTIDAATHSTTDGSGSIGWHYNINDSALDFLGAHDQVVLTFTVQVADGNGGFTTQNVTIIIGGTNESPVITSGLQSGSVTEIADGAAGENTTPHSLSGAVTFIDVNLSDIETSSITNKQVAATLANGYTLSAAQQSALVNAFTIDAATHSPADGSGSIAWHYNINDSALDFLGAHDQVVLTFTVQVADGNGGLATQDVKITVVGAEDAPTITAGSTTATGSFSERSGVTGSTALDSASGSIAFAEVDLGDAHTVSQAAPTFSWSGGILSANQIAALTSASTLTLTKTDSTGTGSGSVAWSYSAQDQTFDFLTAGQTLTITYQVTINDGNGGTAVQSVVVTVIGTDDAFLIASGQVVVLSGDTLPYPVIENDGTIQTSSNNPSTILGSVITGTGKTGQIQIQNNTTLEIDGSVDSGQTVVFSVDPGGGANSLLKLKDPSDFHAKISDFAGRDQIDLLGFQQTSSPVWNDNPGANTGGTLTLTGTLNATTITVVFTFKDGDYTIANFKFASDGNGGTLLSDPPASTTTADASTTVPAAAIAADASTTVAAATITPDASTTVAAATITPDASTTPTDATVTPVAKTSTPTAAKPTSIQTNAASAAVMETASSRANAIAAASAADEAIMIALSTAVAVAVSAAPSDADAGEMPRLGSDSAVDTSTVSGSDSVTVNPDAAVKLSPISDRTAVTLADNATVEVMDGKLPIAEVGSETGAALKVDGSDAVNALVITDGTNVDAINSPVDHTTKTAWHVSETGRGGKTAHDSTVSATSGDTSARSTPADSHFTVGSPLTETPSGSADHPASWFKPTAEYHATADPGISLDVIPKDHLPQHLGANLLNTPSQAEHGADPPHPHVDGNRSPSADDGNAHLSALPSDPPILTAVPNDSSGTHGPATPAYVPGEDTSADNGHHLIADPKINVAPNAEHNGDDSRAAVRGADPAHRQGDEIESGDFKFANDDEGSPPANHGRHANADPETNFPSNAEHSADNSRHTTAQDGDKSSAVIDGAHLTHRQGNESDSAVSKFTNDGKGSPPADHGQTNSPSVAKNHPPQQPEDNSLHTPDQHDENGSPAASGRAHPSHDQVATREPASPKLADDGSPPSAHRPGEGASVGSAPADDGYRNADPKNNDIVNDHPPQRPTDESLHTSAQLDDSGSPAEITGGHLPPGQAGKSEPASAKFADAGSAPPGKIPHDSSILTALNDVGGDDSAHPSKTNLDHPASADPNISDVAKNLHMPVQPDDNGSPLSADGAHTAPQPAATLDSFKFADAGSAHPDTVPNGVHTADPQVDGKHLKLADDGIGHPGTGAHGAHTADPQADGNGSDSFKFVDGGDPPGSILNARPTVLSASSSDSSGTTGSAPPILAQTFDVAKAGMSSAPDQFIFTERGGHDWAADHKPEVIEADHSLPHDVQQLLEIADQMNSASTPEPHHAIAPQHAANVQTQHHQDASHFA